MSKLTKPSSATEKLRELQRLELGTKSIAILKDCGMRKAGQLKKQVQQKIIESGKILPSELRVPTASAIKYLMIDEARIRKLAAIEAAEQEKRDTCANQS
ncbi:hypothetical protein [Dielma fastidiosa]|uniref:hypothetical protein n=1 Tax=Dielma fastidiosa TaxID=1034346 RepID=UPI000E4B1EAC|nr:hypothetical protein [Dielma fastidiosa]RHN01510.1 hypothetical protein DWZ33_05820 [Dielma fastidiosa]